jgi:hypothetical protein
MGQGTWLSPQCKSFGLATYHVKLFLTERLGAEQLYNDKRILQDTE